MTTIFIVHVENDANCAEQIRLGLEAKGYTLWRELTSPAVAIQHPQTTEDVILGSAAMVVVWSSSAKDSAVVERQLLLARRLHKPIIPVRLDATNLPDTLSAVSPVPRQTRCADAVAH